MSKDEGPQEYTEFKATMSIWDLLYKGRLYLVVVLVLVVYFFFPVQVDPNLQYALMTYIAVLFVGWWVMGTKVGLALDTTRMGEGIIGVKAIDAHQLDELTTKCMTFVSEAGPVVLSGHMLYSADDPEKTRLHALLEVQTNTALANKCADWVNKNAPRLLEYERTIDLATTEKVVNEVTLWKELMRIDPEITTTAKVPSKE